MLNYVPWDFQSHTLIAMHYRMRFWHAPRRDVIILKRIQLNLPSPHPQFTHLFGKKIHTKIYSIRMMVQAVYVVSDTEHMQQVSAAYCTVHLYHVIRMLLIHACITMTVFITECIKRQFFNIPWLEIENDFTSQPTNANTKELLYIWRWKYLCWFVLHIQFNCKCQQSAVIPRHKTLQGKSVPITV